MIGLFIYAICMRWALSSLNQQGSWFSRGFQTRTHVSSLQTYRKEKKIIPKMFKFRTNEIPNNSNAYFLPNDGHRPFLLLYFRFEIEGKSHIFWHPFQLMRLSSPITFTSWPSRIEGYAILKHLKLLHQPNLEKRNWEEKGKDAGLPELSFSSWSGKVIDVLDVRHPYYAADFNYRYFLAGFP